MQNGNWMDETKPSPRMAVRQSETERGWLAVIPIRIWVLGALLGLVGLSVVVLWGAYLLRGYVPSGEATPAPIIWTPSPAPTQPPTATPTEGPPPTVSPDMAIGRYVQVLGTGGDGLSLREGPGSNYARMDVALEGEVFIIVEGPRQAGGYDWWKVRDPDNAEREWWAAANFLHPVEHP